MCKKKISFTIILYIICIIWICFILGMFSYKPITMLTDSMAPMFSRGDVVIYKELDEAELEKIDKDTIIMYSVGDKNIVHRVIDVKKIDGNILYQTKGDNNNVSDTMLVSPNQIKGKYVFHIKYIGFPSVWLYNYLNQGD